MASARKIRTRRQDVDEYDMALSDLLAAAGVPANQIVAGETWRVRIAGDRAVLSRYVTPVIDPVAAALQLNPLRS